MQDVFVIIEHNCIDDWRILFVTHDIKEASRAWVQCVLERIMLPYILKVLQKKDESHTCMPLYIMESWNKDEKKTVIELGHKIMKNTIINTLDHFLREQDDIVTSVKNWRVALDAGEIPEDFMQFVRYKQKLTPT